MCSESSTTTVQKCDDMVTLCDDGSSSFESQSAKGALSPRRDGFLNVSVSNFKVVNSSF